LSADALVDPAWRRHFVDRIGRFEASIDVVLRELKLPFRTVVGLSVGDTIPLNMRPDTPVIIRCRGMPISTGLMTRSGDRIAISLIDAPRNLKKEGKIFS
jgi:flagellar motor switch protein FliM